MKDSSKIELKIVRSFSIGFTVYSPKYNGVCVEIQIGFIALMLWSRGHYLFGIRNFWRH